MSEKIIIENEKIAVTLFSFGAILQSFYVKSEGIDIALGLNTPEMYTVKGSASMGKSIGRCANRIGNAKFSLNGVEYTLLANNGPNCLHGGEVQFGDREWTVKEKTATKVVFAYDSCDMESGFPGNLHVEAIYEVKDNELIVTYEGVSDKDTLFNMTNHAYFNLDANKKNIFSHELQIPANKVNLNDENGMAMEESIEVKDTAFDFRASKKIGNVVSEDGQELNSYCKDLLDGKKGDVKQIDNIDTNYIYENDKEKVLCILQNDRLKLEIKSDLPGVQIYTGKSLNIDGKDGHYGKYAGIAMEPQFCPNAINYKAFMKPIIKAGEKVKHTIKYKIDKK